MLFLFVRLVSLGTGDRISNLHSVNYGHEYLSLTLPTIVFSYTLLARRVVRKADVCLVICESKPV